MKHFVLNQYGDPTATRFAADTRQNYLYYNSTDGALIGSGRTRSVERGDTVIRWGCTSNRDIEDMVGVQVVNNWNGIRNSTQKKKMRKLFEEGGVPTPTWSSDISDFSDDDYPLLLRRSGSMGGNNIVLIERPIQTDDEHNMVRKILAEDSRAYLCKYWYKEQEFRVHIVNGEAIFQVEKIPRTNPHRALKQSIWNVGDLWMYSSNTDVRDDLVDVSVKAVHCLGLDFGAVDLMTKGGEVMILEVNSAPGLQKRSRRKYADAFERAGWL